jgi:hypothetical protein
LERKKPVPPAYDVERFLKRISRLPPEERHQHVEAECKAANLRVFSARRNNRGAARNYRDRLIELLRESGVIAALARKTQDPPVAESLVAGASRKPKAQPTKGDESNKKKAAKWSPGREVDPDSPVPGLVRRLFDSILCHAINRRQGRGIAPDRYAEVCREFIDFMEKQTQEYIEAVEPAYIVAVQCKSFDGFFAKVSVQRKCCYLALLPLLGDIDPLLKDADPEWAGFFYDLVRELRAPPKLLLEVLWRGRWRHAKFWGREFDALRLELSNARKRSKRAKAKDRKRECALEYLDCAFHQNAGFRKPEALDGHDGVRALSGVVQDAGYSSPPPPNTEERHDLGDGGEARWAKTQRTKIARQEGAGRSATESR